MIGIPLRAAFAAAVAAAGVAIATPAGAQQGVDLAHGTTLAQTWCVACHIVDAEGTGPTYATPPRFPDIARNPETTAGLIRERLSASHTLMPKMALSERDKDDLIAYILSLRDRPR